MSDTNDNSAINDFNRSHAMTHAEMPPKFWITKSKVFGSFDSATQTPGDPYWEYCADPVEDPEGVSYISEAESQARESRAREEGIAEGMRRCGFCPECNEEIGDLCDCEQPITKSAAASRSGEGES